MAAGNGRVTLALVGAKLDTLTELVKAHIAKDELLFKQIYDTLDGVGKDPGIRGRVDRLEQTEEGRRWHFRTLWSLAVGTAVSVIAGFLWGK